MIAWSCGGGLQSVAIGVLIKTGQLPIPELAGIMDTGREVSSTWEYLDTVLNPYLQSTGLQIERIPHSFARVDLFDESGLTLVPAYTRDGGRLASFCSGEWKRDAFERWLRSRCVKECDCWIGFSIDEVRRVKKDHRRWCRYGYPLIDLFLNRRMCQTLIEEAGLPLPHKSRCWCCPHQGAEEWREVQADPAQWQSALNLEREINERDPDQTGLFLYQGRVPLAMATFGEERTARLCDGGAGCYT